MKIIQSFIAATAILILALVSCSSTGDERTKEVTDGSIASEASIPLVLPAFKMTDVNGNTTDLQSLKGKKVFVNIWATWCSPCRAELPSIEALYSKADKEKVVFVMLSLDENFDLAKQFAKSKNLETPVYYPAEKLPAMFDTGGIPATFISNTKGKLIKQNNGADDYDTEEYLQLLK